MIWKILICTIAFLLVFAVTLALVGTLSAVFAVMSSSAFGGVIVAITIWLMYRIERRRRERAERRWRQWNEWSGR